MSSNGVLKRDLIAALTRRNLYMIQRRGSGLLSIYALAPGGGPCGPLLFDWETKHLPVRGKWSELWRRMKDAGVVSGALKDL